jgi:hypothetical protein
MVWFVYGYGTKQKADARSWTSGKRLRVDGSFVGVGWGLEFRTAALHENGADCLRSHVSVNQIQYFVKTADITVFKIVT